MTSLLTVLFVFMLIAAIGAVMTSDLLSAVIAIGALGFAASVAFLMMKAPDVAIVMPIVEVLALILYIRATVRKDVKSVSGTRDVFGAVLGVVLVVLLGVFAVEVAHKLPEFGDAAMVRNADAPARHYIERSLEQTGAANSVMGVLLDYRGYDTLGEATVLFAAVLGAMVLLRRRARKRAPSRAGRETPGGDPSSAVAGTATEGEGA